MKIRFALAITLLAAFVAACSSEKKEDYAQARERVFTHLNEIYSDTTSAESVLDSICRDYLLSEYANHKDDSLGMDIFRTVITNYVEPAEAIQMYGEASELIKENESIKVKIQAVKNIESTSVGCKFTDVSGPDALTGDMLSIAGKLAGSDKPLLVDFWASWCRPCRAEISGHLLSLAESQSVNILGIAVWEKSLDDTTTAMKELGISWPVIYSGGRENSPSVTYGVLGIPTLILIDTDGTIIGRGHSIEDIDWFNK